ncbi:MAG: L-histidine N(alpha)-methyltransferase [Thermoleophilaceae bacterium]|nr:L-histidine N(alpha)-methyltransferase [Thermoleophilaceae bacterium]
MLGGPIGNPYPDQRAAFLLRLRERMRPDDRLLIGTDLVTDSEVDCRGGRRPRERARRPPASRRSSRRRARRGSGGCS